MGSRSLRVSAVQMVSENGERRANLARAGDLVQEAADAGAKLVALPELFSGGYWLNERAWDTAEPQDGPTEAWLRETAHRHGIYLGGSYLPAVQVNKCGVWKSPLPAFFPAQDSKYEGRSEIADSNGEIVAELTDEEAVIVGDVTLDPARKTHALGKEYAQYAPWIAPVSLELKLYRFIEAMGTRSYRTNPQRRARARAISDAAGGRQLGIAPVR
jgi:predicted amidohydrolase